MGIYKSKLVDYILSEGHVIERVISGDFLSSLITFLYFSVLCAFLVGNLNKSSKLSLLILPSFPPVPDI